MKIVSLNTALKDVRWSLGKIKTHLEGGYPDRALMRTVETIRAIDKFEDVRGRGNCVKPKHHPPHAAIV